MYTIEVSVNNIQKILLKISLYILSFSHSFMVSEPWRSSFMASQTSQSSSTSNTNTTITQPMILLSSITNLVLVKLDHSNYMLWKFQICSTLSAYALFDIVAGTYPCPEKYNKDSNGNLSLQVNLEYLQWSAKDQALISMISATLSQSALSLVTGQKSAKGV